MRAKEFVNEAKSQELRRAERLAGPYAKRYDEIGTYYDMYRLGVAIAGGKDTPPEGPARDSPTVWIMSAEEDEKVKVAEKVMGIKGTIVSPKGQSQEMTDLINSTSPIAKPKRNRYGV
jgi:hypothetical protein